MHSPTSLILRTAWVVSVLLPFIRVAVALSPQPFNNSTAASLACSEIQATLGSTVVQTSGVEYTAGATGAWDIINAQDTPTCTVFPRQTSHVQTAMKAIFKNKAHYAVQAGGHSAMEGWNTVQDGVLILFSHMKDVSYNPSTDTITLQPGVHWGEALNALEPQGVAPVGGRQSDVGTGFLLGGGLSFLSPAYGFGADSFKELDVVLVSGQLVTATVSNAYSDLFRALKGSGNRFGIVTRYEVYAVHTGTKEDKRWFGGSITYPSSSFDALLNATANYVSNVKDPKAVLLVVLADIITAGVITSIGSIDAFYNGTSLPSNIFGEFTSIPALTSTLMPLSYFDIANVLPAGNERGSAQLFGASAFTGDVKLYKDALVHWTNYSRTFSNELGISVLAFTPVLQPQIDAGRARGGNAIAPPSGGYAAVQLSKTLATGISSIPRDLDEGNQLLFRQIPPSRGLPLFLNECDLKQDVLSTYGNYQWLKQVYKKYDPTRFNVEYTNGPLGL